MTFNPFSHYHVHFNDELDFSVFKDRIFAVHLHDNDKSDDLHLMPFEFLLIYFQPRNLFYKNFQSPFLNIHIYNKVPLFIQKEELSEVKWFNIDEVIDMIKSKDDSTVFREERLSLFEELKNV